MSDGQHTQGKHERKLERARDELLDELRRWLVDDRRVSLVRAAATRWREAERAKTQ